MHASICKILLTHKGPAQRLTVTKALNKRIGCTHGKQILLKLGNRFTQVQIFQVPGNRPQLALSNTLAQQLLLPYAGPIRIVYDAGILRLGPLIGILTTGYTGNQTHPFGKRSSLFRWFLEAGASENAFLFVFTPEMVDEKQRSISGWYYRHMGKGSKRWVRYISPFPDVVYERVPNRRSENLKHVQSCLLRLRETRGCQIFNQGFFDKWVIHRLLSQHPVTHFWIPETFLAPSLKTIEDMLERHHIVYLKPSRGSLGLGILRITKPPDHSYLCRFHSRRTVLHRFERLDQLLHHHFGHQPERFRNYLVQQNIALIRYNGRPMDFRVHMHKNRQGVWKAVALGCKIAGPGSITTHIRTGGHITSSKDALAAIFGPQSTTVYKNIVTASIKTAETLESQTTTGPLGELGLDIGIDKNGHVWLFEVNAKPGRHIFNHPSLREAGRESAKCITDYSLRLANFIQ